MAQILRGATGAARATVWLRVGDELRPEASAPADGPVPAVVRDVRDELPDLPADVAAEVRHQGDLLGALAVTMPANDPADPSRERLVRDLAAQAGPVLRNVRLIEELRTSRRRIVAAQDERAKALERNIHDGAQQQLVAMSVKLRLAKQLVGKDQAKAQTMLTELETETTDAIENLRDLARGIYPPLLADKGLAAALEAQARKSPLPVTVGSDGIGRYPQEVEAAVYFCCLEALSNVAKYAEASRVEIRLRTGGRTLEFQVTDDGRGFDLADPRQGTGLQGMADRLDAIGGSFEVRTAPGAGTTVGGSVPAEEVLT
jgi:signal transduction histidine kinase